MSWCGSTRWRKRRDVSAPHDRPTFDASVYIHRLLAETEEAGPRLDLAALYDFLYHGVTFAGIAKARAVSPAAVSQRLNRLARRLYRLAKRDIHDLPNIRVARDLSVVVGPASLPRPVLDIEEKLRALPEYRQLVSERDELRARVERLERELRAARARLRRVLDAAKEIEADSMGE
jgi:hypothetical protein